MVMSVNTNVLSLTAQRNMMDTQSALSNSIQRLSTGLRINSAKDDAAGLAIAERFTSSIRGGAVAQRNANDGISFAQTAEGALDVIGNNLQRIRELAVQSLNDSNTDADRAAIDQEVVALKAEVDRIAQTTTFNGRKILDGSLGAMRFQIGAERGQTLDITGKDARADELGELSVKYAAASSNQIQAVAFAVADADLVVDGEAISLTGAVSIQDVAEKINSNTTLQERGVFAEVGLTRAVLTIGDATNSETFEVNGVAVTTAPSDTAADIVQKINDAGTGATASVENLDGTDRVVLTDETGRNITVEEKSGGELFNGIDNEDELSFEAGLTLGKLGGSPPTTAGNAAGNLGMSAHQVSAGVQATVEDLSVATRASSNLALLSLDKAIDQITSMRADLGAIQNRFENVIEVAGVQNENLSAARSRIQDADFAAETANLTRAQILQQAGLASLAQANASPQAVLVLLR